MEPSVLMEETVINIFNIMDISYDIVKNTDLIIERSIFLNDTKYQIIQNEIPKLKDFFSSSFLTSLQKNANLKQKWPLLNLIRQILKKLNYQMVPIRKSNGYDNDGKKIFKRFFLIKKLKV
tara:strand:- start:1020 stop:1382 length:363 start_codon:yes stop_codon:yes gene_type:complete